MTSYEQEEIWLPEGQKGREIDFMRGLPITPSAHFPPDFRGTPLTSINDSHRSPLACVLNP
jgi:hypothetical protein